MMLAAALAEREDELRADLQQQYGVDLDHAMAGAHSARHVGALVAQLPPDARIRTSVDEDAEWTMDRMLFAGILNSVQGLAYMLADKRKRGPRPDPVGPSWLRRKADRKLPARVLSIDALMEELSKPREDTDGQ